MRTIKKMLAGIFIIGIMTSYAMAESVFPDVSDFEQYADAVKYVKDAGIMVGDDKGNFNPNSVVNRAQMATIVCQMLGETNNSTKSSIFTDVPESHWANANIKKASELGIVSGYGNGKFGPSDDVTYEQCITMIISALGGRDLAVEAGGYPDGYVTVAEQHGFLENIQAKCGEPLSRKDIAVMLYNCADFSFLE